MASSGSAKRMGDEKQSSQISTNCSFRSAAVNAVAVIPLLSGRSKDSPATTSSSTSSARSFNDLFGALRRYAKIDEKDEKDDDDLLLVVPNSSLTRPGDWKYSETPVKAFHWQQGCQRLHIFDGRSDKSDFAQDRLNNPALSSDWIDLVPSRRTAAVIGILNMHDCQGLEDLHRAEEELHEWSLQYGQQSFGAKQMERTDGYDRPIERLFVYDSFDEDCQKIDLSKSNMGNKILAFPPTDEAHIAMMQFHMNVVINDLAVAIFLALEAKIQESDRISQGVAPSSLTSPSTPQTKRGLGRMMSGSVKETEEPVQVAPNLTIDNLAGFVSPDSKLAKTSPSNQASKTQNTASETPTKKSTVSKGQLPVDKSQLLLTPIDDITGLANLSSKETEALRKRDAGRREKLAADLALLCGSPLDAYARYLKAAEIFRTGILDPLWYASSLEGCASAHIAMAEAGGFGVDEYLENNFQLPDEIMQQTSRKKDDDTTTHSSTTFRASKQTLPEIIFALCDEALSITSRHSKLAAFHTELILKLAYYCADIAEAHLRCRWGEGEGCYAGDPDHVPRWEKTSVSKLELRYIETRDGDMNSINTLVRTNKVSELLHQAVSVPQLNDATRLDVALRCAQLCLIGVKVRNL